MTSPIKTSKHVGLFVIPKDAMGELRVLDERSSQASRANQDDVFVLENAVYRRSLTVSLYHRLFTGRENSRVYIRVLDVLYDGLKLSHQDLYAPEDVHGMARDIPRWEQRVGGEDKVIARIRRRARRLPVEGVRAMYRAFKEVIAAADERDAGFVTAVLREGAEERLAAERAERERAQRGNPLPPLPDDFDYESGYDTEEYKARKRATIAWVEANNARYKTSGASDGTPDGTSPDARSPFPVHIVLVPRRYAASLHKLMRKAETLDDWDRVQALRDKALKRASVHAHRSVALHKHGEITAVNAIIIETIFRYKVPKPTYRDYSLIQTRRFSAAMETWLAERGIAGVIDDIANTAPGPEDKTKTTSAHAFHTLREALADAVRAGCATFLWGTI